MAKREVRMTLVDGVAIVATVPDDEAWPDAARRVLERKLLARVTSDPEHPVELRCDWTRGEAHWRLHLSKLPPEPADDGQPSNAVPCPDCKGSGQHRKVCQLCYFPGQASPSVIPPVLHYEGDDDTPCPAAAKGSDGLHGPYFSPGPCGTCGGSGTGYTPRGRWLYEHFSRATLTVAVVG